MRPQTPYPIARDILEAQLPGHQISEVHIGKACNYCNANPAQPRKIYACGCERADMCIDCLREHFSEYRVYNMSEIRKKAAILRRKHQLDKQQREPRDR